MLQNRSIGILQEQVVLNIFLNGDGKVNLTLRLWNCALVNPLPTVLHTDKWKNVFGALFRRLLGSFCDCIFAVRKVGKNLLVVSSDTKN